MKRLTDDRGIYTVEGTVLHNKLVKRVLGELKKEFDAYSLIDILYIVRGLESSVFLEGVSRRPKTKRKGTKVK